MTVFLAHAPADLEAAEALEKYLERRGLFVELDDGQTALRPVQPSDVVVLLLSKEFVCSPTRLRLEQRALDAWTDQRLLLVRLDAGNAPVGLRDLPAVDASAESRRESKWREITNNVSQMLARNAPMAEGGAASSGLAVETRKSGGGLLTALFWLLLALPGVGAAAATASIWLVNRIGPSPGSFEDLRRGIDAFGMRYGAPAGVTEWVFLVAMIVTMAIFVAFVARLVTPRARAANRQAEAPEPQTESVEPAQTQALFVSYARANEKDVLPILEAAKAQARAFWLGEKAGQVVRAVSSARGVVVMCSKAAFESDEVKRAIFLADRYRKKLTPVFIEQAQAPEDFAYFFAGAQPLNLFETPAADRPQALIAALGAAT